MQVQKLPAVAGLIWINAGFRIMFGHFKSMVQILIAYVFAFFVLNWCASLADPVGVNLGLPKDIVTRLLFYAFVITGPALSIGYMQACRDTLRGDKVGPLHVIGGFVLGRRVLLSLLGLGLFKFAAVLVTSMFLPTLPELRLDQIGATPPADADAAQLMLSMMTVLFTAMAVETVVWYAPMLAAWHRMRAGKAVFFSIAACWRNKAAFFMWGVGWLFVMICVLSVVGGVVQAVGQNSFTELMLSMVLLLLGGTMYCSIYVTYSSVFVDDVPNLSST